jgi:serine/threonine protein kinase
MELNLVKCLWSINDENYGIKFTKSGQVYEVYTKNMKHYTLWKEALRRITLVSDFHDEYNITKQIGQGSFARVYHAKRKGTNNQFAVKAFPKEALDEEDDGV